MTDDRLQRGVAQGAQRQWTAATMRTVASSLHREVAAALTALGAPPHPRPPAAPPRQPPPSSPRVQPVHGTRADEHLAVESFEWQTPTACARWPGCRTVVAAREA